jgi:hypothetical protein
MKRFAILCLLGACILGTCSAAQVSVTTAGTGDPRLDELIAHVKGTPASRMDQTLPAVSLSDWLLAEAGPDAKVTWAYRPPRGFDFFNPHFCSECVEAYATMWNGRHFSVLIANGMDAGPTFYSGTMMIPKEGIVTIRRLSDLPGLLWKVSKNLNRAEAKR